MVLDFRSPLNLSQKERGEILVKNFSASTPYWNICKHWRALFCFPQSTVGYRYHIPPGASRVVSEYYFLRVGWETRVKGPGYSLGSEKILFVVGDCWKATNKTTISDLPSSELRNVIGQVPWVVNLRLNNNTFCYTWSVYVSDQKHSQDIIFVRTVLWRDDETSQARRR